MAGAHLHLGTILLNLSAVLSSLFVKREPINGRRRTTNFLEQHP
jgi:hypothetical protein